MTHFRRAHSGLRDSSNYPHDFGSRAPALNVLRSSKIFQEEYNGRDVVKLSPKQISLPNCSAVLTGARFAYRPQAGDRASRHYFPRPPPLDNRHYISAQQPEALEREAVTARPKMSTPDTSIGRLVQAAVINEPVNVPSPPTVPP